MAEQQEPADDEREDHGALSRRATPLTFENVFEAVRRVQDWRELGEALLGKYHPTPDKIQEQHGSDVEACLKTLIEAFLRGEGRYQPSWRRVIHALHCAGETHIARDIMTFAEPVEDPTLTVDDVTKVMDKIEGDKWWVMRRLGLPRSLWEEIERRYCTDSEKSRAYADYYVHVHPDASWRQLTEILIIEEEYTAARESKSFMSTDPTLTVDDVTKVMDKIEGGKWKVMWELDMPGSLWEEIERRYSTDSEKSRACADCYVHVHPDASWHHLTKTLYEEKEFAAARQSKSFMSTDPTLTVENVSRVMEKVESNKRMDVWQRVFGYSSIIMKIENQYSTAAEREAACVDHFLNIDPESSWVRLAQELYHHQQVAAVEEVKSYLPPRDLTITTNKLMEQFASMNLEKVDWLGHYNFGLSLPKSEVDKIKANYDDPSERKEAYLDLYVHQHPCPSWQQVVDVLRELPFNLDQQADFVESTYLKVSEKTQQSFDAAMMEGEVSIRNGSALLVGVGGSGKTHVLASILEEAAPEERESTPCAKAPVRTVAHCKAEVSGDHFVRIDDDQYSEMLIATVPKPTTKIATKSEERKTVAKKSVASSLSPSEKTPKPDLPPAKVDVVQSKHSWCVRRAMKREYLGRMQAGRLKKKADLNDKEIVDFRDSGGQSMFHETLPVFIHNTMFGMVTVKLNERLDSYPKIEYYTKGKRVGEPFDSTFTHLETFRHCMRVVRSTCDPRTPPKIMFVGTHRDLEKDCPGEDREMKEKKLRSIIPPAMEDSIVTFGESLLLAVNAKTPGKEDEEAISFLRKKMREELRKLKPSRIPLRYIPLEMAFRRLAKDQGKSVLSKEECFQIALTYNFTRESFEAALKYLHSLKLIFYYEEILPDVVFIDAQALLDKITELVVHSLKLHSKSAKRFLGALKKFVTCGIVTMEILCEFESHYVPNVFEKKQLVDLFKYLRIMAEVGKGEYLMPCLLKRVEGLPCLMPGMSSLVVPALLFYFGRDGPLLGVYCFLLSTLITEFGWVLLEENGYPVQVCRNQARFVLPGKNPGCVTITDSFSTFFHVAIEPAEDASEEEAREIYGEVCPKIRETVLTGIRKASQKLNYTNSIPEVAFPCAKHEATSPLHPATISTTELLTCTDNPRVRGSRMTDLHRLWFKKKAAAEPDAITQRQGDWKSSSDFLDINDLRVVLEAVWVARAKWYNIGIMLDISASTLDAIKTGAKENPDECFTAMIKDWLSRDKPRPSWASLEEALKSTMVGRVDLATEVSKKRQRSPAFDGDELAATSRKHPRLN